MPDLKPARLSRSVPLMGLPLHSLDTTRGIPASLDLVKETHWDGNGPLWVLIEVGTDHRLAATRLAIPASDE